MTPCLSKACWTLALLALWGADAARAQQPHRHGADHHGSRLHFSHPLIAESPSPDTKVRFDIAHERLDEHSGRSSLIALEAEYAFSPGVSVEVGLPYVFLDPRLGTAVSNVGDVEVALKLATFALAQHGVLLGGGVEVGIPTGSEEKHIGGEHFEIEPFVNAGVQRGRLEAVTFVRVGIPTSKEADEPLETELAYNVSVLYHLAPALEVLLEHDGRTALSGGDGEVAAHLTPGLKLRPLAAAPSLLVGVGHNIPVTAHREFASHTRVSLFYHF